MDHSGICGPPVHRGPVMDGPAVATACSPEVEEDLGWAGPDWAMLTGGLE
jgi:hypothetical protein